MRPWRVKARVRRGARYARDPVAAPHPPVRARARKSVVLAASLLLGCPRELSIGELIALGPDGGDGGPVDAQVPLDASSDAAVDAGGFCAQRGPLYDLGDGVEAACSGSAAHGFHYALCVCGSFQNAADTLVDGFDSRRTPVTIDARSGSLALHGSLALNGSGTQRTSIGGSLVIAGDTGAPVPGHDIDVLGNLADRGQLEADQVTVGGDAQIGGRVQVGTLRVGGTLTLAPGTARNGNLPSFREAAVNVTPPCRCTRALDFTRVLDEARATNDDARIGLDANEGLRALSAAIDRTLPCGHYYVDALYAARPITLRITGRVALYVRQGVLIDDGGSLTVRLAPGAELDLIVGASVTARERVDLGEASDPTRMRLYVGGGAAGSGIDTINLLGGGVLAGSLYAPTLALNVEGGELALTGAAVVGTVTSSSLLKLRFDRALVRDTCAQASCASQTCRAGLRCDGQLCLP